MITLVLGGASSGKSKFAEDLTCKNMQKLYIATMKPNKNDIEVTKKINAHKIMRKDKNFATFEGYNCSIINDNFNTNYDIILLECMSNLLANEMFNGSDFIPDCEDKILDCIKLLETKTKHLIIVSNDIFHDGNDYDEYTLQYIKQLGLINQKIAKISTDVFEIVYSIPIKIK